MSTFEKVAMGVVGIALATTLLLRDRQTVPVIGALDSFVSNVLSTAMGTRRA